MIQAHACELSPGVVADSAAPWTVTRQAPLSMGFSGKNAGVGCCFLPKEIFLIQGSNSHLLLGRLFTTEPPEKLITVFTPHTWKEVPIFTDEDAEERGNQPGVT